MLTITYLSPEWMNIEMIKPFSERRGLVFHKFYEVKRGRFWQFQCESTQNICEIASVMKKTNEISYEKN